MLKSQAEQIIQRALEETGAHFTDEQIAALSIIVMKIAGRLVEEAVATWKPRPGSRPTFFSD